jgi:hypothetical protein
MTEKVMGYQVVLSFLGVSQLNIRTLLCFLGSNLFLEVISGPSAGLRISQHAKERQSISLTVGRIPQNDLVLNDPEVSGKHALISWNSKVN